MARGGQARGPNRQYEEFCRDVLRKNDPELVPVAGDGVGVPFEAAGTTWSFDVGLHVPAVRVVVAECRRRIAPVKQEDLAGFAFRVERFRQALGIPVAGVFFAKRRYQVGAVRSGQFEGISMAIVADCETINGGFAVQYHGWDAASGKRTQGVTIHVGAPPVLRVTAAQMRAIIASMSSVDQSQAE